MIRSISGIFRSYVSTSNSLLQSSSNMFKLISRRISTHCWRTHTCGELRRHHIGERVTLCGWAEFCRGKKFVILRDWQGQAQMLLKTGNAQDIPVESVVKVCGTVQLRPDKDINLKQNGGDIEVHVDDIEILNACRRLPFSLQEFSVKGEEVRMRYRYLDIRSQLMQSRLRIRSGFISSMRQFLIHKHGFVEVETPTLFRPTPGGAKEFIVPSSVGDGMFYSLPQSPQQFKQLLMVGGIDRYFQVARCYRDEGAKPDRQPEFTQLDIEMSFVSREDIMCITENMIKECWPGGLSDQSFPRMTYSEAMDKYGTDKPDLRIDLSITDVSALFESTETVNCVVIPSRYSQFISKDAANNMHSQVLNSVGDKYCLNGLFTLKNGQLHHIHGDKLQNDKDLVDQLAVEDNSIIWISWGVESNVKYILAKAIRIIANTVSMKDSNIIADGFKFMWVYDFPLFEMTEENTLNCVHHPFTAPHPEDLDLLPSDPTKVRSLAYDLVLNGSEVAGGSIRIHDSFFQRTILKEYLNIDSENLEHLLEALDSGAPPHGGIAFGLDRLLAMLCGTETIRDIIAFPKSSSGRDLMCGAPCKPGKEILDHFFKPKDT